MNLYLEDILQNVEWEKELKDLSTNLAWDKIKEKIYEAIKASTPMPIRQTTKSMDEQRNLGISLQEAPTLQMLARYKECPGLCELLESQKWSKKNMQEGTAEHGNEIGIRGKNKS